MITIVDEITPELIDRLKTERCAIALVYTHDNGYHVSRECRNTLNEYDNSTEFPDIYEAIPYKGDDFDWDDVHFFWSKHFGGEICDYAYPIIKDWSKWRRTNKTNASDNLQQLEQLTTALFGNTDYQAYVYAPCKAGERVRK